MGRYCINGASVIIVGIQKMGLFMEKVKAWIQKVVGLFKEWMDSSFKNYFCNPSFDYEQVVVSTRVWNRNVSVLLSVCTNR